MGPPDAIDSDLSWFVGVPAIYNDIVKDVDGNVHYYNVVTYRRYDFMTAQAKCNEMGGRLAELETEKEFGAAQSYLLRKYYDKRCKPM